MKQKTNKFTAFFCAVVFLITTTSTAYADTPVSENLETAASKGVVTNVTKGTPAPFDGILLSKPAAAKLFGELKFFEDECKLTLSKQLEIATIKSNAEISSLKLKLDVETTRTESLLKIKDERIQFLEKNWRPPAWYESGEFWLAVGIVSGVLVTVAAGHAISTAK